MKSTCSLSYHDLENSKLDEFATGVKNGIKNNPLKFPAPPVSELTWNGLIPNFTTTLNAWKKGGIDQRGAFLAAKGLLMDALDETAKYVDPIADGNEATIIAAGFTPTKTVRVAKPAPGTPTGVTGTAKGNGKIESECDRMEFAEFYGAVCSTSPDSLNSIFIDGQFNFSALGTIFLLLDVSKDRVKSFSGLTGGKNYYVQFYCGNGKGTSILSEPVRIMATV